jgi:hypothetical protein
MQPNAPSAINLDGGRCANCHRQPVSIGIPVFINPSREGQEGVDTAVWCLDCVRSYFIVKIAAGDKAKKQ